MDAAKFEGLFREFEARFEEQCGSVIARTRAKTPEGLRAFQRRRAEAAEAWGWDQRLARLAAGESIDDVAPKGGGGK